MVHDFKKKFALRLVDVTDYLPALSVLSNNEEGIIFRIVKDIINVAWAYM